MKIKTAISPAMKLEKATPVQIALVILLIIFLVPPMLKLSAYFNFFDFSNAGQIGDTLGGITAPFINGLSAILIFVAFKAQIEANNLIRDQDIARTTFEQIKMIQDNSPEFLQAMAFLINSTDRLKSSLTRDVAIRLSTIDFTLAELELAIDLIAKYHGDKTYLRKKLSHLYTTMHSRELKHLFRIVDGLVTAKGLHQDYAAIFKDFKKDFDDINDRMNSSISYLDDRLIGN